MTDIVPRAPDVSPEDRFVSGPGPIFPPSQPARPDPAATAEPRPAPSLASDTSFHADRPAGEDLLGLDARLSPLVELVAHARAEMPISLGLFGTSGSGTSFAAGRLLQGVRGLAARAGGASPFLSRILTVEIDGASAAAAPSSALANGLWRALVAADPDSAALAEDAAHSLRDPQDAAREANERLAESRRRLETERQALEDVQGRRARLAETVLYDTAGSRVDAYGRANRASIEARLRRFGFLGGDPLATWKDLVRMTAERGSSGRVGAFVSALWTYQGQARLVITAVILFALAWGLGEAQATQSSWIPWLRDSGGDQLAPLAGWLQQHMGWLGTLRQLCILLALFCLALDVWRAFRFLQPLWRGASLLQDDIKERRQALDGAAAHQTRHVDTLATEVEAASQRAAAAERRAGGTTTPLLRSPFRIDPARQDQEAAQDFLRALSATLETRPARGPQRIVVALDGLHGLAPGQAMAVAAEIRDLLALPGFVFVLAGDPARLAAGADQREAAHHGLTRLVQVPFQIASHTSAAHVVTGLTGPRGPASAVAVATIDPTRSRLDQTISPAEQTVLQALAPLAGPSPRALKRFVNLYRLARHEGGAPVAVALALAVDIGCDDQDRAAFATALRTADDRAPLRIDPPAGRLAQALAALQAVAGPLDGAAGRAGQEAAAPFSMPRTA